MLPCKCFNRVKCAHSSFHLSSLQVIKRMNAKQSRLFYVKKAKLLLSCTILLSIYKQALHVTTYFAMLPCFFVFVYRAAFPAENNNWFFNLQIKWKGGKCGFWRGPPIIFDFKYWCRCFKCLIVKLNISIYITWESLKKCLVITFDSLPIF